MPAGGIEGTLGMKLRYAPLLLALIILGLTGGIIAAGWLLAVRLETSQGYAPIQEWLRLTALVVGLVLVGAVATMVFFWRQQHAALTLVIRQTSEQESLRKSEEWYRTLFLEAMDGICLVDVKTGLIVDCNQALIELVGREKSELIGQPQSILHPRCDDGEPFSSTFRQHMGDKAGHILDTQVVNGKGETIEVAIRARTLTLGGRTLMQGLFRDITDRKRAEEALQRYAAELEAANKALEEASRLAESATRAKTEFLANMSHEIRTPMTAILGYANLVLDENVGPAAREHIAVIRRNGEHLLNLIGDILDLSKIEAGKMLIEPVRCSPIQLAAEVASLTRPQAVAKQLELKTELFGPLPEHVQTDPLRLRQVLINLVGNAIKFTDHGEVRLSVRLAADCDPPRLCFEVADTGIGMTEEQMAKLFQPFTQVDGSATRRFGGTGLGLCICKYLTEALGGNMEVRSEPGQGSVFRATVDPGPMDGVLMIENPQESLADWLSSAPLPNAGQRALQGRILVAEDGADNQRLICALLRKAGAEVAAVENGQLAVESALAALDAGEPFDMILMDMQMPVMDGYEATRRLREAQYASPIVALTAHAMSQDRQRCLDAGCDDYLAKPVEQQGLVKTILRCWARNASAGPIQAAPAVACQVAKQPCVAAPVLPGD